MICGQFEIHFAKYKYVPQWKVAWFKQNLCDRRTPRRRKQNRIWTFDKSEKTRRKSCNLKFESTMPWFTICILKLWFSSCGKHRDFHKLFKIVKNDLRIAAPCCHFQFSRKLFWCLDQFSIIFVDVSEFYKKLNSTQNFLFQERFRKYIPRILA